MDLDPNMTVRLCTFELHILQATISIKFPCTFFPEWKTTNNKKIVSSQNRYKANAGTVIFNQKLRLTTEMVMDEQKNWYRKKDTILLINLASASRPNEPKLVGRLIIDLAQILNLNQHEAVKTSALQYSSVEANITFNIVLIENQPSEMEIKELDKSEFKQHLSQSSDVYSFGNDRNNEKNDLQSSTSRVSKSTLKEQSKISLEERLAKLKSQHNFKAQLPSSILAPPQLLKPLQNEFAAESISSDQESAKVIQIYQKLEPHPNTQSLFKQINQKTKKIDDQVFDFGINPKEMISDGNENLKQLQRENHEYCEKIQELEAEIKQLKFTIKHFEQRKSEQQQRERSSMEILNNKIKELCQQMETLKLHNQEQELRINESGEAIKQREEERIKAEDELLQLAGVHEELLMTQYELVSLKEEKQQHLEQINNQQHEIIELTSKQKSHTDYIQSLTSNQQQMAHQIQLLKLQEQSMLSQINNLQKQSSLIKNIVPELHLSNKLEEQIAPIVAELEQKRYQLQLESEKLSRCQQELSFFESKQQTLSQKIQDLTISSNQLHNKLNFQEIIQKQLNNQIGILVAEKKELLLQHTAATKTNQQLQVSNQQLLKQIKTIQEQAEIQRLSSKLQDQSNNQRIVQLEMQLRECIQNLEKERIAMTERQLKELQLQMKVKEFSHQLQIFNNYKTASSHQIHKYQQMYEQTQKEKIQKQQEILQVFSEKNEILEAYRSLEKENQINYNQQNIEFDALRQQISHLESILQKQFKDKQKMNGVISEYELRWKNREKFEKEKENHYEEKIEKFKEKEKFFMQNLELLESESNKILNLVQEKQQNEERMGKAILQMRKENQHLKHRNIELETNLSSEVERNEGLAAELELLSSYADVRQEDSLSNKHSTPYHLSSNEFLNQLELLKKEVEFYKAEHVNFVNNIQQLHSEKDALVEQSAALTNQNQNLQRINEELNRINRRNINLPKSINDLEKTLKDFQSKITKLEDQNSLLDHIRTQNELKLLDREIQRKQMNNCIEELKHTLEKKSRTIKELEENSTKQKSPTKRQQDSIATSPIYQILQNSENHADLIENIHFLEEQITNYKVREEEYYEKFIKLQNYIDKLKSEQQHAKISMALSAKSELSSHGQDSRKTKGINDTLNQLLSILNRRKNEEEIETVLRMIIDSNASMENRFDKITVGRCLIQEKAKSASKQIQKVKSSIMKSTNRNINQKTQLTSLLKPCELILNQLVDLSESLAEQDEVDFDQNQQIQS